jgi:uncharacterized protein YacL
MAKKWELHLKRVISLVIAASLAFPIGSLFREIAVNRQLSHSLSLLVTFIGVLIALFLGLIVLPFITELISTQFIAFKMLSLRIRSKKTFLLDSSCILDGRVIELVKLGILERPIVISSITLEEISRLKNSSETYQNRVKRGFELIEQLKKCKNPPLKILPFAKPPKSIREHLITLAKQIKATIITLDASLTDLSKTYRIPTINIHDLSNAFRIQILPKEQFEVLLSKVGKEPNQAIGYLDDGMMVIVENGKPFINQRIIAECTSLLQSTGGKIIFGRYIKHAES